MNNSKKSKQIISLLDQCFFLRFHTKKPLIIKKNETYKHQTSRQKDVKSGEALETGIGGGSIKRKTPNE